MNAAVGWLTLMLQIQVPSLKLDPENLTYVSCYFLQSIRQMIKQYFRYFFHILSNSKFIINLLFNAVEKHSYTAQESSIQISYTMAQTVLPGTLQPNPDYLLLSNFKVPSYESNIHCFLLLLHSSSSTSFTALQCLC